MSERTNKGGATSGQKVPKSPKSKFRAKSQQEQTAESKLRMEKRGEQLDKAKKKLAKQKPPKKSGPVKKAGRAAGATVHGYVHGKLYEVEHENVGTESAHRSELVGEAALRSTSRYVKKQIREHPAKAVQKAESRHIKATADYQYRATVEAHPEMQKGGAVSRYIQKQKIKRQYAKQAREAAKQTAKAAEKTAVTTEKLAARAVAFVKRHPVGVLLFLACFLLLVLMQSCMSSAVTIGNGVVGAIGASTYAAEDADLRGAEAAYCGLEAELQDYLDSYESTHDYDEYHFELDDIEHDPYVLLSIISAIHEGAWTVDEVQGTLQMLFEKQYILTETVVTERRYYLETDTWTDEEGNTHTDTYRVYYDYYICTVTLENFNLSHLPIYIMGEDQLSRYALYMSALGNRPDLFPSSPYVAKYTADPVEHEIPEAYLADETFAAILEEAEKYIGYPYVWGGYKPSTSFDCSGFVSYVYNQCGWDFGRLGAQGLYNISRRTSSPRPGDLVFFTGTYDTPGVSHVGIYVGDGWMLHCGDPIGYANLNTSYWQSHFYAYGRLSSGIGQGRVRCGTTPASGVSSATSPIPAYSAAAIADPKCCCTCRLSRRNSLRPHSISALPVPILPNRSAVFLSTPEASPCWPGMCFVVIVAPGSHSPQTARLIPARTIQTAL